MVETTSITVTREQIVENLVHHYRVDPLLHTKKITATFFAWRGGRRRWHHERCSLCFGENAFHVTSKVFSPIALVWTPIVHTSYSSYLVPLLAMAMCWQEHFQSRLHNHLSWVYWLETGMSLMKCFFEISCPVCQRKRAQLSEGCWRGRGM